MAVIVWFTAFPCFPCPQKKVTVQQNLFASINLVCPLASRNKKAVDFGMRLQYKEGKNSCICQKRLKLIGTPLGMGELSISR